MSRMWNVWVMMAMATGSALAAEPVDPFTEPDEEELFRAEERVVTVASRYAQPAEQASSVVTVLTGRDFRERGYRTLADALSSIPGIFIATSTDGRSLAWIRGITSDDNNRFLLLVDGVPWADGVYTHAWIDEYLPLSLVKQVEVIQGPGSAMYGSSAFGGVINVVTYAPSDLSGGFARMQGGSFGRRGIAVVGGDRLNVGGRSVGVRAYARALALDGDGLSLTPSGEVSASDDSPREALGAGISLELAGLTVRYDHVDYHHSPLVQTANDPLELAFEDPDRYGYRYHNDFLAASWGLDLGHIGRLRPYILAQRYDNPGLSVSGATTLVDAERVTDHYGAGAEAEIHLGIGHVTVVGIGAEADRIVKLEDEVFTDGEGVPVTSDLFAPRALLGDGFAFVQHQWSATWWLELNAGARLDYRAYACLQTDCVLPEAQPFGSPRLGVTLTPGGRSTWKVLYGRAFRAPNARELVVTVGKDDSGHNLATASNPDLLPEVIDTVETELAGSPTDNLHLRLDAFGSRVRNQIETDHGDGAEASLGDVSYQNAGGMDALGAQAEVQATLGPLGLAVSYAWTHAVDRDTGRLEYGFPPHMGHGRLSWQVVDGLSLAVLGDAFSAWPQAAWSPDAGLADGPATALLHAAVAADGLAHGHVRVDFSVRNLLNTRYTRPLSTETANALNDQGEAAYPFGLEGEARTAVVGLELSL